jgi:hypothetical protein
MSHFAKVENGRVTQVIVAEQDFINSGAVGDPSQWIQTSYNTRAGIHYGPDGKPDSGNPFRANYAGAGYYYDSKYDIFYPPQPWPSWTLESSNGTWVPPTPYPQDGKPYGWDEQLKSWKLFPS